MSEGCRMAERVACGIDYREISGIHTLHAAISREKPRPTEARATIPLCFLAVCAAAVMCAGYYAGRYSSEFAGKGLAAARAEVSPAARAVAIRPAETFSAPPAQGALIRVTIRNMQFIPAAIVIAAGDSVEWTNEDITPHTATSGVFDSGPIEPEKSWRHTFAIAGTVSYSCTFHPHMKATVVVKKR